MSRIHSIENGRAIRAALRRVHRAVVQDFALREDALKLLEMYIERLIEKASPSRLADLPHSLAYMTTELDLTVANLKTILICCECLDEQYRAERASA
jgi:hypothetical protein